MLRRMSGLRARLADLAQLPSSYWFLWLGTIINRLGGFVIPFLTLYLTSRRGISVGQAGLIVALFGAGSFAAQLAGGELADRLGRRPVLLLSLLGAPPLMLALGLAENLVLIAGLTAALGLFTDLYRPAANAAIADLVPASSRMRAFAYMYWAINLGAALAPIAAGFVADINYLLLFIGDAITTLIYGLIVLSKIPETQPAHAMHAARSPLTDRVRQLGREPILLALALLALISGLVYMQGLVTLPLDMRLHGLGPSAYGFTAATNGIVIVLLTFLLSHLIARWAPFRAMALGALLFGLGFGLNAWAASLPAYVVGVVIWTLGEIIGAAVAPTIIANLAPVELRGLYQGIYGAAWGLSFFIGPLLGSWIFERYSPDALWLSCAVLGGLLAMAYLALSARAQLALARDRRDEAMPHPAADDVPVS